MEKFIQPGEAVLNAVTSSKLMRLCSLASKSRGSQIDR